MPISRRRILAALPAALAGGATKAVSNFDSRVGRFEAHWNRFLRAFWGCAPDDLNRKTCNPALSAIDRKEYEAARKAAAELFDLQ